jgi:nucleotide-binding universal stress UspA family protein
MGTFKHILVPTDFGEPSRRALQLAAELAGAHEAALTVMHAVEAPAYPYDSYGEVSSLPGDLLRQVEEATRRNQLAPLEDVARRRLDALASSVAPRCPRARTILKVGVVWQEILEAIEETRADLVVIGTHGRRGVTHALLGSVAEKMVRMSPVPVLTVRAE